MFVNATVAVQCLCIVLVSMVIAYIYTYRTIDFLLALTLVPTGKVYKLISLKAVLGVMHEKKNFSDINFDWLKFGI